MVAGTNGTLQRQDQTSKNAVKIKTFSVENKCQLSNKHDYGIFKIVTCYSNFQVAVLTKGQRNNPFWSVVRKGRITASNFGIVLNAINKGR